MTLGEEAAWALAVVLIAAAAVWGYRRARVRPRATEERFLELFAAARDPILLLDREGRFFDCNEAAVREFGAASRAEVIGHLPVDFSPEVQPDGQPSSGKAGQMIREAFSEGSARFEWKLQRADGSTFIADVGLTAASDGAAPVLLAHLRDISERKREEAEWERRLRLEAAIVVACTRLINVELPRVNEEIDRVLHALGRFAGADRSYVFLLREREAAVDCTHEWHREGVSPQIATLQGLRISDYPWLTEKLLGREVVFVRRTGDLPPEASPEREQMLRQGVESMIVVPLELDDRVIGFVGFDSVTAEEAWTEESATVLKTAARGISNALGRREMEAALRESEARYRSLVETTSDWIWEVDAQGVYTYASPKVLELLGYEPSEVVGRTPFDLMPPQEAERMAEAAQQHFERREPFSHLENFNLHKDGHVVVLDTSGVPIVDNEGVFHGFRGIDRDVTEQRRAQEALRESEARYRQFLQISAEGIWRLEMAPPIPTDLEEGEQAELVLQGARVVECNEVFARRNGFTRPGEMAGMRLDELWQAPHEAKVAALAQAVRSGYRITDLESSAPLPDGSQGHFLDNFVGLVEGGFLVGAWGTERDITRRREAEDALQRERDLVSHLMDTSPLAITAVNRAGEITFANAGAERVLGLAKEETTGLAYNDPRWRITDYDGGPIADAELPFRKVQSTGQAVYDVRHAIVHPDGRRVLLSINAAPFFTEAGEFDGMVASIDDVTEQRRAEEALRESEQRFRAIVESTRDWIWFCDTGGVHRYSNRAIEDLLGRPPEEIVGRAMAEFMHPEDQSLAFTRMERGIAERTGWSSLTLRWRHRNGTYRYLESTAAPAFDATGELLGWYGADRDVTERLRMEEAIGRSESRLRALFAAMSDVILIMDAEGRHLEIAPTRPDLWYRPADEVLGRTVTEIFPAEQADLFLDHIRQALRARQPVPMAYTLPIGGREVRFAAEVSPLSEDSVIVVARDVTAQTEQYEQLLATERARAGLAEHLNEEINHRARNNLAMVSGLLQMQALQEPDPALAARLREAVARIRTFVDIHEKIYGSGAERVDLLEVLREVAATLGAVYASIGAVFSVEGTPASCATRAATNLAVVTNELITNALKYGGPGRDGRLHVAVQLSRRDGQMEIRVQNSGNPVPEGFDAAAQPGMGLRLASDMAAQHGGAFTLRPIRGGSRAELVVAEEALGE